MRGCWEVDAERFVAGLLVRWADDRFEVAPSARLLDWRFDADVFDGFAAGLFVAAVVVFVVFADFVLFVDLVVCSSFAIGFASPRLAADRLAAVRFFPGDFVAGDLLVEDERGDLRAAMACAPCRWTAGLYPHRRPDTPLGRRI